MASFDAAIDLIEEAEGGYQNHPNDSGNYNSLGQLVGTNRGISAPTYERHIGRPPTMADMQAISWNTAKDIYRSQYWERIKGDQITRQDIANIFMDGAVNHGVSGNTKLMQKACNAMGSFLVVDGIVGPLTLAAVNGHSGEVLHETYKEMRRVRYHEIVKRDPAKGVFLNGWMNRLNRFPTYNVDIPNTAALGLVAKNNVGLVVIAILLLGTAAFLYAKYGKKA